MAISDYDLKKDFDNDYNEGNDYWYNSYQEMYKDLKFYLGDQWSPQEKTYLKEEQRNGFVYNYCQRNIHLNSGYQRKNRLGFGIDPQEVKDEEIADYLQNGIIWQANKCNFYNKFSDGFEDCSIGGISIMSFGMDYSRDIVNGRLTVENKPFQSIMLDRLFTKQDLSDCRYIQERTYMSKDQAKNMLPEAAREIEKLKTGRMDNKFDYMNYSRNMLNERDMVSYDEYYKRITRSVKVLIHKMTGEQLIWRGTNEALKQLVLQFPVFDVHTIQEPAIKYSVFIQNELMYEGEDPLGINEYPHVLQLWVFKPQYDDYRYKIQGMIRPLRDPQAEYNQTRSQITDIIKSQAHTGLIYEEGSIKNEEDAFKTGQGTNLVARKGMLDKIRPRQSIPVNPSLFQLVSMLTTDLIQIPGLNEEALGVAEGGNTEVSGTLAKQRAANSVTIFQTVYDRLNYSQQLCGQKMLKIMLANYTPQMWEKITGKPFPQDLNMDRIMDFDVVVKETQLTDSQRNLAYYQSLEAKKVGIDIPQQFIIENMPIADKTRLKEMYMQQAEMAQQQQQQQQQLEMIKMQALIGNIDSNTNERNTRALANEGLRVERQMEAQKDLEQASYDKVKALKELQGMDLDQLTKGIQILNQLKMTERAEVAVAEAQTSQEAKGENNALGF